MTEHVGYYYALRNDEATREATYDWWLRLTGTADGEGKTRGSWSRALRAELRHAAIPDAALLSEGFRNLWFALPQERRKPRDMLAWGCVAAVLAEIRTDDPDHGFAQAMGMEPEKAVDKPRVSQLRFAQLQRSVDLSELQTRMRRAIHLLKNTANVLSVTEGILHWHQEQSGRWRGRPSNRLSVRWAMAYFSALPAKRNAE